VSKPWFSPHLGPPSPLSVAFFALSRLFLPRLRSAPAFSPVSKRRFSGMESYLILLLFSLAPTRQPDHPLAAPPIPRLPPIFFCFCFLKKKRLRFPVLSLSRTIAGFIFFRRRAFDGQTCRIFRSMSCPFASRRWLTVGPVLPLCPALLLSYNPFPPFWKVFAFPISRNSRSFDYVVGVLFFEMFPYSLELRSNSAIFGEDPRSPFLYAALSLLTCPLAFTSVPSGPLSFVRPRSVAQGWFFLQSYEFFEKYFNFAV